MAKAGIIGSALKNLPRSIAQDPASGPSAFIGDNNDFSGCDHMRFSRKTIHQPLVPQT
jgi:hypothetical protein